MNDLSSSLRCPVCSTALLVKVQVAAAPTVAPSPLPPPPHTHPAPPPHAHPAPPPLVYPTPPPRGLQQPPEPPAPRLPAPRPAPAPTSRPAPRPAQPKPTKAPRPRHRLSPQATLLSLGVLLLLAAGVTFLAVTWDSLPVAIQAAIMATLAAIALAGSVPASKNKLAGTAEALAILGSGLLAVDLYGARELGLIPATAIDGLTYAALSTATVAAINLLMSRLAPKVVTYGVAAVIVGQLPLTLFLSERVGVALQLLGLLIQVVITLLWTTMGNRVVRITGAICSALVFSTILIVGAGRVFLGMLAFYSRDFEFAVDDFFGGSMAALSAVIATTAVICLAALTGIVLVRKFASSLQSPALRAVLPAGPRLIECVCVASAAFTVASCLPQIPVAGRWLTTGVATALALTELLRPRRTGAPLLLVATVTVALVNLLVRLSLPDVLQLGLIAAIVAALAVLAGWRGRLSLTAASTIASFAAQAAILLGTADGFLNHWTGGVLLAGVGACSIAFACLQVGRPSEAALLGSAASAVLFALLIVTMVSPATGTGVVLTIAAAPLVAYGMQPDRREALLFAGLLLAIANTAFVLGAGATTLEWFTLPPAAVMLAIGLLRWRDQHSWVYLGPGLLMGLAPSTLIAGGDDGYLRVTFVVAAALVIILIGVRFSLQAPFIIGAAALAKMGAWQFLEVAPLIPRWITLALAGAILLAVGATYERRISQAKQAAQWITALR